MHVDALSGKHKDADVYIVGTGPSLRCLPLDYFKGKVTIGLNQAWRYMPLTYSITVHPELLPDYDAETKHRTQWIVKKKPPRGDLEFTDPVYYVFNTTTELSDVSARPSGKLYLGEGVQTTAMDLAARMGARTLFLVGCDANNIGGDFHGHDQHVRWLGLQASEQYALYRKRTAQVRTVLRGLGVNVMTLSPFIGTDAGHEDYVRFQKELKLPKLPAPKDISPYKRKLPRH